MKAFRPYVEQLESMATQPAIEGNDWTKSVALALDGEPGRQLAGVLSLKTRRRIGAFFTGRTLARRAVPHFDSSTLMPVFFDPTCGAGDLLLAAAQRLPVLPSLVATLDFWGSHLTGCDTNKEFVRAAKARLLMMARQRTGDSVRCEISELNLLFPLIRVDNGLTATDLFVRASWVIMNPPYGFVKAPKGCNWAAGKLTAAAVFLEASLINSSAGTRITAILPDVLRSGSRFERWRDMVSENSSVGSVRSCGLFDPWADIDVFILDTKKKPFPKKSQNQLWFGRPNKGQILVGDLFDVHVGSVVPHRHPQRGFVVAYLHARSVPSWSQVKRIRERRRFKGRLFEPPFVVIRRTSRPEDGHRAICTLITGARPVAVENHLIVCSPRNGQVKTCRQLIQRMKRSRTSDWLNSRIRCRHLTVAAIRETPWWDK